MTYDKLKNTVKQAIFRSDQLKRIFPNEPALSLKMQMKRWVDRGKLIRLKRGLYLFPDYAIDEFVLSSWLYNPSYISLESALNNQGVIPDIPQNVTAISPVTSKRLSTPKGMFEFSKIAQKLFFGFRKYQDPESKLFYDLAYPEKALLDYIYIRKITGPLKEYRINIEELDRKRMLNWAKAYPAWVQKNIYE